MSEFIGFKYGLVVNGVDLSARVTSMKDSFSQEIKEWMSSNVTGTSAQRHRLPGVQDESLDVTMKDDFSASGAGSVHNTVRPLIGNTGFTVVWSYNGPTSSPSTTNPVYTMTAILDQVPTGGSVNEVMEKQVKFMLASGTVSVATT
jgi:hypothetical protein